MTPPAEPPHAEYTRRLKLREEEATRLTARDRQLANLRLGAFGLGIGVAWMAFWARFFSGWWLVVPVVLFFALVLLHDRAIRRRQDAERAAAFYRGGLARLEGRWAGAGSRGERFRDPAHPYADDLDLFGRGSLFELLCTTRTRSGEETLARWLLAPASAGEVLRRQASVADLRPRLDLREELALLGEEVRHETDPGALIRWGERPVTLVSPAARVGAAVLAVLSLGALAAWGLGYSPLPFFVLAAVSQAFAWPFGGRVREVLGGIDRAGRELAVLARLLERLEREPFEAPLLRDLRARLDREGRSPSEQLGRLEFLVGLLEAQRNGVFAFFAWVLLWPLQLAFALEAWRKESGPELARWLAVAGEIEALAALSGYAYEHPADPFPEVLPEGACFEAEGLAHPLLPEGEAVRNDLRLGDAVHLYLVSGSNMSGKSTLLRAVGTNTVLALAGAPVRARRLRVSPLQVGASIRVQDSLQGGVSRFYAEITRLRQIVDLTREPLPLLFLLDEILHGTNSHDRRIGAEAVVRGLLRRGAVGLVTTHDLALARIAEDPELAAANVHFQDTLEEGTMSFDYHLRAGIVERSNALELMRAVGLEV